MKGFTKIETEKLNAKDEVIMFFNQTQSREEVRTASWSLLPAALPLIRTLRVILAVLQNMIQFGESL